MSIIRNTCLICLVFAGFIPSYAFAETLCKPSEMLYFSAYTGKPVGDSFVRNNKLISLCGIVEKGVMQTLSYRFGTLAKVELEFNAPKDGNFTYFAERNSPRGVDYAVSFLRGDFKYQLNSCLGMTCNQYSVELIVYRKDKVIATIVGDNADLIDNFFGEIVHEGNVEKSKIFKQ